MEKRFPRTPNRLGFESAVQLLSSLGSAGPVLAAERIPVNSPAFLQAFMDASRFSRSLKNVRAAVNHFCEWLDGSGVSIYLADGFTLERFRTHKCGRPGRYTEAHHQARYIGILSRLIIFLQYQGLHPSYGWTCEDSALCSRFRKALFAQGLRPPSADQLALHAVHFVVWARLHRIDRSKIDQEVLERFAVHNCRCGIASLPGQPKPSYQAKRLLAASRWIRFLESGQPVLVDGIVARATRQPTPNISESFEAYHHWLDKHRGLRSSTIHAYMTEIVRWHDRLGDDATTYTAAHIREIARVELEGRSPTGQSRFITVMRSYLRFRAGRGDCQASLAQSLISRPVFSKGTVPRSLPFETLRGVIDACHMTTTVGIRDRAILTLLLESGMRAGEVAALRLDDIDWDRAELKVRGKAGRAAVMPLTQGAGEAILDWLEHARPSTNDDALFVRLRRPHTGLLCRGAVTVIVSNALKRANLPGAGGAHLFRHSLARKLLKEGSGLPDIAGVLRHQSLDTTMIYAKVDEVALSGIARAWPRGRS